MNWGFIPGFTPGFVLIDPNLPKCEQQMIVHPKIKILSTFLLIPDLHS